MEFYLCKEVVRKTDVKELVTNGNDITVILPNIPVVLTPVEECKEANNFQRRVLRILESSQDLISQEVGIAVRKNITDTSETMLTLCVGFLCGDQNKNENMIHQLQSLFCWKTQFEMDMLLTYLASVDTVPSAEQPLISLKALNCIEYATDCVLFLRADLDNVEPLNQLLNFKTGFVCSKFSLKVILNEKAVEKVYLHGKHSLLQQKLLRKEILFDMKIQCENGEMVKCHKVILAAKSQVFHNVLENHKPKYLVMKNMSVECVKALLEYVYCDRVESAVKSFDMALELLKAGLKYQIIDLTNVMIEIFMCKKRDDLEWFSVKNAIKLFAWARNHEKVKKLRDKSVCVLKNFANHSADQLRESEEYQNLFRKEPMVAIELSILFVQL